MKRYGTALAVATAMLAFSLCAFSQYSTAQSAQSAQAPITGQREAMRMTRARAELMRTLDAKKDRPGSLVQAKLAQKITLSNGTKLPDGTILMGHVTVDDMQQQGMSKLALRFNQAHLKDGTVVPIKATIVGIFGPGADTSDYPEEAGDQVPNSWTDGTLQVDQIGVLSDIDLHSKISSRNSGVLVSTKKDNFKLDEGSEIQFAIAPGRS